MVVAVIEPTPFVGQQLVAEADPEVPEKNDVSCERVEVACAQGPTPLHLEAGQPADGAEPPGQLQPFGECHPRPGVPTHRNDACPGIQDVQEPVMVTEGPHQRFGPAEPFHQRVGLVWSQHAPPQPSPDGRLGLDWPPPGKSIGQDIGPP